MWILQITYSNFFLLEKQIHNSLVFLFFVYFFMFIECVGYFWCLQFYVYVRLSTPRDTWWWMDEPEIFEFVAYASLIQSGSHVPKVFDSSYQVSGVSFSYLTFAIIYSGASFFFCFYSFQFIYNLQITLLTRRMRRPRNVITLLVMYKWCVPNVVNSARTLENIFIVCSTTIGCCMLYITDAYRYNVCNSAVRSRCIFAMLKTRTFSERILACIEVGQMRWKQKWNIFHFFIFLFVCTLKAINFFSSDPLIAHQTQWRQEALHICICCCADIRYLSVSTEKVETCKK